MQGESYRSNKFSHTNHLSSCCYLLLGNKQITAWIKCKRFIAIHLNVSFFNSGKIDGGKKFEEDEEKITSSGRSSIIIVIHQIFAIFFRFFSEIENRFYRRSIYEHNRVDDTRMNPMNRCAWRDNWNWYLDHEPDEIFAVRSPYFSSRFWLPEFSRDVRYWIKSLRSTRKRRKITLHNIKMSAKFLKAFTMRLLHELKSDEINVLLIAPEVRRLRSDLLVCALCSENKETKETTDRFFRFLFDVKVSKPQ